MPDLYVAPLAFRDFALSPLPNVLFLCAENKRSVCATDGQPKRSQVTASSRATESERCFRCIGQQGVEAGSQGVPSADDGAAGSGDFNVGTSV